jgi:hypothetical protein
MNNFKEFEVFVQNQAPNFNFDVQLLTWKTFDLVLGVGDDLKDKFAHHPLADIEIEDLLNGLQVQERGHSFKAKSQFWGVGQKFWRVSGGKNGMRVRHWLRDK